MRKDYGEIYISGRAICDALGISRQQLNYYTQKYIGTFLMTNRKYARSNLRVGKYRRKKLVEHYSLLFFLAVALRTNSPRAILFLQLLYEKAMRKYNLKQDYLVDEIELIFAL